MSGYTVSSKPEYHEYIYDVVDKRAKISLSQAALEVLAIIAYNPKITRAEIETIRGVDSNASLYSLDSLEDLPNLPNYKMDENRQIVIDDILEEQDTEKKNDEISASLIEADE